MAWIGLLILLTSKASQEIGTINPGLDPGRITWWKESWSHGSITLSENHAKAGLSLSFHYRASTSITNGIIEVVFPSGVSHASLVSGVFSGSSSVMANTDGTFTITGVTISTAGEYGPFGIRTRESANGQVVDVNSVFGSIYVYQSISDDPSLTVSSGSGQTSATISTKDSLSFAFTMPVELWKHDIVKITPSTYYTADATVSCISEDVTDNTNYATGPDGSHNLPCEFNSGNVIVYGISDDIPASSKLKIKVSSFTLPGAAYTTGYSWTVEVLRFATTTTLAKFVSTAAPLSLVNGVIAVSSWEPSRSYPTVNLVANIEMFTQIVFSIDNPLPASGTIVVEFSGVDVQTPVWYYADSDRSGGVAGQCLFTPYVTGSSCVVNSATQLTITVAQAATRATQFTVDTLTQFVSSPKLTRITSYTSGSVAIDQSSLNPITKTLLSAPTYHLLQVFEAEGDPDNTLDNSTGRWKGGILSGRHLYFKMQPTEAWTLFSAGNGASLELQCPFVSSGLEHFKINVPNSATWQEKTDSSSSNAYNLSTGVVNAASPTVQTDIVTLNPVAVAQNDFYALVATGNVYFPLVASNLNTFYECYILVSNVANYGLASQSTTYHVAATRLTVLAASPTTLSIAPICNEGVAGIPLLFSFTGEMLDINFASQAYELQLEFTSYDLALGTSSIPVASDEEANLEATYSYSANTVILITGFESSLLIGSSLNIYVPNGNSITTTINYSLQLQYSETTYGSSNVIFKKTGTFVQGSSGNSITSGKDSDTYLPSTVSAFDFTLRSEALTSDNNFIGIIGPTGLDLTTGSLSISGNSPAKTITLSSSDPLFSGNVIFALETTGFKVDNVDVSLQLAGVMTPQTEDDLEFSFFEATQSSNLPDTSTCIAHKSPGETYSVDAPAFSQISVTVSSCKKAGPTNVDTTMTISILITHPVPIGGVVSVTIDSSWTPSSFAACSSSTGDACTLTGSVASFTLAGALTASSTVTLTITGLQAPISGSTGSSISFLQNVSTSVGGSNIELSSSISASCSLEEAGTVAPIVLSSEAFPNSLGMTEVDFLISLSTSVAIPANSEIRLSLGFTSWLYTTSGSIKEHCWSTIPYKDCLLSNSAVQIDTLNSIPASTTFEIYLDNALNLPVTTGSSSSGVTAVISWNSIRIAETSTGVLFTTNAQAEGFITPTSLTTSVSNAGEAGNYTFAFTSEVTLQTSHKLWIVFPSDYDAHVGNAWEQMASCNPGQLYLECSSSTLASVECTVDHWVVVVKHSSAITAGQAISVNIHNVRNPVETTATGYFKVYQIDSSDRVKAYSLTFATMQVTALPSLVTLKEITVSSQNLRESSTYEVEFYKQGTIDNDNYVSLLLPEQYDIGLARGTAAIDCSSVYFDTSGTEQTWTAETTCSIDQNFVQLVIGDSDDPRTFASNERIRLSVQTMPNPQWGLPRVQESLLYDTTASSVFPGLTFWTTRFEVYLYDHVTGSYDGRSYPNVHAGYLGFDDANRDTFEVNSYTPETNSGRIMVFPGTQTALLEIQLSWPMISETLTMQPTVNSFTEDNGNLNLVSDFHGFKFFQWVDSITFRAAAHSTLASGVYYVEWTLMETLEDGNAAARYASPVRTLVEVCSAPTGFYRFILATLPTLYKNYTSVPIKITPELNPASDVTLALIVPEGITLTPSTLTFRPFVDALYFTIKVESTFEGDSASLEFEISGNNAGVYQALNARTLTISTLLQEPIQETFTLSEGQIAAHSASFNIIGRQNGIFYWWLGCDSAAGYDFSSLKAAASDLTTKSTALHEQLKTEYGLTEVNPEGSDSIYSFLRSLYAEHCATLWINSQVIYAQQSVTLTFDWLFAATKYNFTAYLDNGFSSSEPEGQSHTFTTPALPSVYKLQVELHKNVPEAQESRIRQLIANRIGVNPDWLSDGVFSQTDSKSFFEWNVLFNRKFVDFPPSAVVARSSELEIAKEDLVAAGFASSTSQVFFHSEAVTSDSPPQWVATPTSNTTLSSFANFTLATTSPGLACGACASAFEPTPSSHQVLAGLTAVSLLADGAACVSTTAGIETSLEVDGLVSNSNYYCFFALCSDYPLWPSCRNDLKVVNITTSLAIDAESINSAALLALGAVLALIY